MRKLKVLGICAANGASLFPFHKSSKFEVIGNAEPRSVYYTKCQSQWKANFGDIPMNKSVEYVEDVDIIIGNPDCGHSSVLSYSRAKKLSDPKKNGSLNLFFGSIQMLQPKVFMMENLEKLLDSFPLIDMERLLEDYNLTPITGSVSRWGNSQLSRERLIIIGVRKDVKISLKELTEVYSMAEPRNCEQLLEDLQDWEDTEFGHVREPETKEVCLWYNGVKQDLKTVKILWNTILRDSRTWPGHYKTKTQPGVYKLFRSHPPKTVRKSNRQFNYNGEHLTPREMARIQGIPDDFKLFIDGDNEQYWINKARTTVAKQPPYEIALWFKRQLIKYLK